MRMKLFMDVDTGVDDALALALAVASDAELVGVSTVAGNVSEPTATENTLRVLDYLGAGDVPVYRGASQPLVAPRQHAEHIHGENGLGGAQFPATTNQVEHVTAPQSIIDVADRYAGDLVLVMTGPLTNLAIALSLKPTIVHQVRRVVVMGGALFVGGNVTPQAEFNVYADPDAMQQVSNSDWDDLMLVGLDVTHQTVFNKDAWSRIPGDATGAPYLVREVMRRTFTERGMDGSYLHDPLAVAVALDPGLVGGEVHKLRVGLSGDVRGKLTASPGADGVVAAVTVDADRFVREMSERLGLPIVEAGEPTCVE